MATIAGRYPNHITSDVHDRANQKQHYSCRFYSKRYHRLFFPIPRSPAYLHTPAPSPPSARAASSTVVPAGHNIVASTTAARAPRHQPGYSPGLHHFAYWGSVVCAVCPGPEISSGMSCPQLAALRPWDGHHHIPFGNILLPPPDPLMGQRRWLRRDGRMPPS